MSGQGAGSYRPPDFAGTIAVVTGGGQGIGAAVARRWPAPGPASSSAAGTRTP